MPLSEEQRIAFSRAGISPQMIRRYHDLIFDILMGAEEQTDFEDLLAQFCRRRDSAVSDTTFRSNLKDFVRVLPDMMVRIVGFYPDAATILGLAAQRLAGGQIVSGNLMEANEECKRIVDAISRPRHLRFLSEQLAPYLVEGGASIVAEKMELMNRLYDTYPDFVREEGNGLVSIAGRLNEEIFIQAMINAGMSFGSGNDFMRTGQNSEADLIVFQQTGTQRQMFIEVKSYHARERLLRGLQDISQPEKIGIGFFINPAEFNPGRTRTLLQSNARAIYLPDRTYASVDDESKAMSTVQQDLFYRPLSRFVSDMQNFVEHGRLSVFR